MNQNSMSNKQDFFIGGTTNLNSTGILKNFSNYMPDSSGRIEFFFIIIDMDPIYSLFF